MSRNAISASARPWVAPLLSTCLALAAGSVDALRAADAAPSAPRGHLLLVGGGEKPHAVLARFLELAGGPDAPIAIVPVASGEADTGSYYVELLAKEVGARNVTPLDLWKRDDASDPKIVATLRAARGIWFAGGDQNRVTDALLGTPAFAAIRAAFDGGAVIGGTSAGTACMSRRMITGNGNFEVIADGAVEVKEGLGLFPAGAIVDQHFVARQRLNRLLSVVLEHPEEVGVGIDEDTAVLIGAEGVLEVLGDRSVVVVDAGAATIRRGGPAATMEPPPPVPPGTDSADTPPLPPTGPVTNLGAHDLRVHILVPGERYDLGKRVVVP